MSPTGSVSREHTDEVLAMLGYDAGPVASLRRTGAIA
jgi:hypothetical protein